MEIINEKQSEYSHTDSMKFFDMKNSLSKEKEGKETVMTSSKNRFFAQEFEKIEEEKFMSQIEEKNEERSIQNEPSVISKYSEINKKWKLLSITDVISEKKLISKSYGKYFAYFIR